jgi:hypothetical protein
MELFICQYCGSERKNKKSVASHQAFCKSNPNRSNHDHSKAGAVGRAAVIPTIIAQEHQRVIEYNKHPKICKNCGSAISHEHRKNIFCDRSCAATYNNKVKDYTKFKPGPKPSSIIHKKIDDTKIDIAVYKLLTVKHVIERCSCKECGNFFWVEKNKKRKTCSVECRNRILSRTATNNPKMGGNKNNKAYGWYESTFAGRVWLESSWELKVAQSLDKNEVEWYRPKPLPYDDKLYYPDFYIPMFNVYLDPKNPYLQIQDQYKIEQVSKQNSVKILVLSKNELSWQVIQEKIKCPISIDSDALAL